ncbi:phosphopantetheine-binding protein [Cylindrospermum sp. NIES-4074]|nr:phosphopantetheine-binding protein [Cylindrospermum sp. NIES-4074]
MSISEQPYTAPKIQAWLVNQLAELLGVEAAEIDITAPLDSYGLDSAQAMLLAAKAGKFLGFQLSPLLLWHYPTIESLSQRLAEEAQTSDSEIFEI